MTKLQELYAQRDAFAAWNSPIPAALVAAIASAEEEVFSSAIEMIVGSMPTKIDLPLKGSVVLAAEYVDGKLTRIGSSSHLDFCGTFRNYKDFSDAEVEEAEYDYGEEEISGYENSGFKRGKSIGFSVKFADGKIIKHTTARRTMIESLRYMGLERASKYRDDDFKGYPLIGKKQRPTEKGRIWQKYIDGWWVYVNMSNARAVACLKGVADMLNISIEIVMDESTPSSVQDEQNKHKRTKYSLNGGDPSWKNRTVWNAVRNLLKELPNANFKEISDFFPKHLQGSYGVVATVAEIEERNKRNKSEYSRWFLDPSDILVSGDGVQFAVSAEWGDNFENFRNHVVREFGWTINEV